MALNQSSWKSLWPTDEKPEEHGAIDVRTVAEVKQVGLEQGRGSCCARRATVSRRSWAATRD